MQKCHYTGKYTCWAPAAALGRGKNALFSGGICPRPSQGRPAPHRLHFFVFLVYYLSEI